MSNADRRKFLTYFATTGLTSTLLPGVLWAEMQQSGAKKVTADMLKDAAAVAGLEFTDAERAEMVEGVNNALASYEAVRALKMDWTVAPPIYFNPVLPGMKFETEKRPFRLSPVPKVKRPSNIEEVAFWPVTHLAELIRTRQVTSTQLTQMYLSRLRRYDPQLKCVVTLTEERALRQATQADEEIAKGKYRGVLHGIPWGCKDIIAVRGYPTTLGAAPYQRQDVPVDATVVSKLDAAGAILIAKLATSELASPGDLWFGGQTKNPWNLEEGSSGSSAGSAAATAAGLVAFGIGTQTGGSILSPSIRCGAVGLVPTFGRVSRHGVMPASWTTDRVGPICRTPEDCAAVAGVIAGADGLDLSVASVPFNYQSGRRNISALRIGFTAAAGQDPVNGKNFLAAIDLFRHLGAAVRPIEVPALGVVAATGGAGSGPTFTISRAEQGAAFEELYVSGRFRDLAGDVFKRTFAAGAVQSAISYVQWQRTRTMLMQALANAFQEMDLCMASQPGIALGVLNTCGYPGLAVPTGFSPAGRPTHMVLFSRLYDEEVLIAAATAYQSATNHHLKQPPLFATAKEA